MLFSAAFASADFLKLNCSPIVGSTSNGVEGSVQFFLDTSGKLSARAFDNYIYTDVLNCSDEGALGIQCKGLWNRVDGSLEVAVVRLNQLESGKFSTDFKRSDENGSQIITYQCK